MPQSSKVSTRTQEIERVARAAARSVEIDADVPLTGFLCTSPGRLGELVARIETAAEWRFAGTRPHGVLIFRAAAVGGGALRPIAGEIIPVRGRLAVFGERAEDGRETQAERSARAPYLVACVVGRAIDGGPSRCCRPMRIPVSARRI